MERRRSRPFVLDRLESGDALLFLYAEHLTWFEDFGAGVLRHSFVVRPDSTSSP
jgi:hypothetical protein